MNICRLFFSMSSEISPSTVPTFSCASILRHIQQIVKKFVLLWKLNIYQSFDVLLTVHISIFISVINQIDTQNFCFIISLFHASTCFEHHVLIIRRSKLHYTASSIITTCFEHMCSSSGGQNCITQPLVSSHLQLAVSCNCARDGQINV